MIPFIWHIGKKDNHWEGKQISSYYEVEGVFTLKGQKKKLWR